MSIFDYINTRIGTDNAFRYSNGNVYPVTSTPFGTAQFTLQTDGDAAPWFYNPRSHSFEGIRLTHQASPWVGDFGQILLTPFTGKFSGYTAKDWSSYIPEKTQILPYKISVKPNRYNVKCELTPTCRGCCIRFVSESETVGLSLSGCGSDSTFEIKGRNITGVVISKNPVTEKIAKEYIYGELSEDPVSCEKNESGVLMIKFPANTVARLAFGFVSPEQTKLNFKRELFGKTFEEIENAAKTEWQNALLKIEVKGDEDLKKVFYSCMYRACLYPMTFYEIDKNGENVHFNPDTRKVEKGRYYTCNGFWDTYRTVYPFLSLVMPEKAAEAVEGFINHGTETGWLPKWLTIGELGFMPGSLIESVIAESAVNGLIGGDLLKKAYELLKKNAFVSGGGLFGRRGLEEYEKSGFVPREIRESVNQTFDFSYGDWCVARVAEIAGDYESAEKLFSRSLSYKNLFDKNSGFFRSKDKNAKFSDKEFSPYEWGGDNCECSSWQNAFSAIFDIDGMADLYGGTDKFEKKLDDFFAAPPVYEAGAYGQEIHEMSEMACADFGQMAISNQPSFHIPWLYSAIGKKQKTEYYVEKLVKEAFKSDIDGFPGDEDNGTMACWFIFACLGFYPLCPGSGEFVCSKPLFDEIKICGGVLQKKYGDKITLKELRALKKR